MYRTMTQSTLTIDDQAKARRFKTLWYKLKDDLQLTQVKAAGELGITQPTFSQYLNAVIPMNYDITFKIAELLKINPSEIDPTLQDITSLKTYRDVKLVRVQVPYIGSISGRSIMGNTPLLTEELDSDKTYAGIAVDNNAYLEAGIPKGSTVILDLAAEPYVQHRNIAVRLRGHDGFHLYKYHSTTRTTVRAQDLANGERMRSMKISDIAQIHLVYQITMPE